MRSALRTRKVGLDLLVLEVPTFIALTAASFWAGWATPRAGATLTRHRPGEAPLSLRLRPPGLPHRATRRVSPEGLRAPGRLGELHSTFCGSWPAASGRRQAPPSYAHHARLGGNPC